MGTGERCPEHAGVRSGSGGEASANPTHYDRIGRTYARTRQADPRIAELIEHSLGDCGAVANIGAGTGSYEPGRTVTASEPNSAMIARRPPGTAPAVQAAAENLPLADDSVDAALAVLTAHHWDDLGRGIAEMARVARRRIVILTWDHTVVRDFWLLRDYLPAAAATDAQLAVPMHRFGELLGEVSVQRVPIPADCTDGFGAAYWSRPYLDSEVQAGMSMLALTPARLLGQGFARLSNDLATEEWKHRYGALLERTELDVGYRLVTAAL
ncbi:class I SAM-dependent methyltransferase [Actinomadura sp. NTSP31]|uniref:class I SAM-dependent methyltransferase n=1 Tax=Actinomadura sp. NTSP31 TaxID=1735447 RepID=UPI0035BFECEF